MRILLLIAAMVALAMPARAAWREARSDHFIIYSEDKPETLRQFAIELERFDAAMRFMRGIPQQADSPSNRLTIFLVPSTAEVARLYGKGGTQVAGFYHGRAGASYAVVPRATGAEYFSSRVVLLHEYSHHFMARNFPFGYPAWFREGFAEFNSTARFNKDGSVDIGLPANHRGWDLAEFSSMPIQALLAASYGNKRGDDISRLYSFGWLLTHFLTFDKERKDQLGAYLRSINTGTEPAAAAEGAFGDLRALKKDVERYLSRNRFAALTIKASALKIGDIELRELSPGASAIMPVHIRSHRGVDEKEAAALVPLARKTAAAYPNDAFVQLALTEAELDAGNLDEAEAAAERALAADPASLKAMVFRGTIAVEKLRSAPAARADDWKAARRWFIRANRADPAAPAPLVAYYASFAAEGKPPPVDAAEGLYSAAELAAEDRNLRFVTARQYLIDDKPKEARRVLVPTAYDPHGGSAAEAAASLIAAIDAGGAGAALAAWRKLETEADARGEGDKAD